MTLNQIFDNIMYGEKYMKNKAIKEEIERCVDREIDLFYASKRAKQLSGKVALTESEEQKINRIISKVSLLEDRIEKQCLLHIEKCKQLLSWMIVRLLWKKPQK